MSIKHSREQVRSAKREAADLFKGDSDITSIGIGMTEDLADLAVTITVRTKSALSKLPQRIGTVPVRSCVTGKSIKF